MGESSMVVVGIGKFLLWMCSSVDSVMLLFVELLIIMIEFGEMFVLIKLW